MHSYIQVANKIASVEVSSGFGVGHIKLTGATFPIVPSGTIVDKLSIRLPEGLHALAFSCRVEGPHRMGSGKMAYLDNTPYISASVLLVWEEDDKLIVKADRNVSAAELAKFNPFTRSDADILVVDTEHKIVYISTPFCGSVDPEWTYKSVSMKAILKYITKKLTMEQLDERATSEQEARDELRELRDQKCGLQNLVDYLTVKVERLETENNLIEKQRAATNTILNGLTGALMKSKGLYKLLKRLPAMFRPKAFDGFVEAMDSFN